MVLQRQVSLTWSVLRHLRSQNSLPWIQTRHLFSKSGHWDKEFNKDVSKELEAHWKPILKSYDLKKRSNINNHEGSKEKFYVLSMFPYPSGSLHMGHVRVYTISDVMARFNRLRGKEVIHPMGWDAFGLPAENAAIERGEIPDKWTKKNIASMKKQLDDLGCSFDWNREFATCDPDYYKWTQYIFLKMYEAGLVYRKKGEVNWDPVDQTVLADEQISEDGLSWRSGAKVEKRNLEQWFIKTTAYSQSLLEGLDDVNADLWRDIIDQQKNWIGELIYPVTFDYKVKGEKQADVLEVYTSCPEYIYGVSHIHLTPDHPLYHQYQEMGEVSAIHPVTLKEIPVIFTEATSLETFRGARLGIPCLNEEDEHVAKRHGVTWTEVIDKEDSSKIINSEQISGQNIAEARQSVIALLKSKGAEGKPVSKKLNDWLISRQRYWGTPIPFIHCQLCQFVPVPYEDLPVVLPPVTELSTKGGSPLTQIDEWVNTTCPKCGGEAKRETDTMDTFVDSSWYYLRYLDPTNQHLPFDRGHVDKYMPVDLYIGGKEHAVLHLYFARFFNQFLNDLGMLKHREPFVDLLTQGMVMGQSYRVKDTGQYLRPSHVDVSDKICLEKGTSKKVEVQWEKMSKSKYNGVDPQDVLSEFGVDSTRLCILANVSPMSNRHWSNTEFKGITKWQYRIWTLVGEYLSLSKVDNCTPCDKEEIERFDKEIFEMRNLTVREVSFHFKKTYLLNTAISRLQSFTNLLKKCPLSVKKESYEFERSVCDLVVMLSPFAPMFSSELWCGLNSIAKQTHHIYSWNEMVWDQQWPTVDESYQYPMIVRNNGKDWEEVRLPAGTLNHVTKEDGMELLSQLESFREYFKDRVIKDVNLIVKKDYRAEIDITSKYTGKTQSKEKHKTKMNKKYKKRN